MALRILGLALTALAATAVLARATAPVAREARTALLLWLALRGARPHQRPELLRALPPLAGCRDPHVHILLVGSIDAESRSRRRSRPV
ncbi:hypothetical protein [Micromonospora sp. AKA38]|uniref:hypothetical protein n=1 Tax=Micromonospora sp. AKA38 TaxID=2733861 RepID=UPI0024920194|nr:hypothetical protein [Micromonospora sp. AKA38]